MCVGGGGEGVRGGECFATNKTIPLDLPWTSLLQVVGCIVCLDFHIETISSKTFN